MYIYGYLIRKQKEPRLILRWPLVLNNSIKQH